MNYICNNITSSSDNRLLFAGQDVVSLAKKYGTPLYLFDENKIREKCQIYKDAIKKYFPSGSFAAYASKACSFKQIYRIMTDEDMGIDVVSSGEIYTAKSAGFNMSKALFHGNAKTDFDIGYAMDNGVGYFVCDNIDELNIINEEAAKRNITQKILLRLTPGIDPHTYAAVNTGCVDSKFGSAIETGQAEEITKLALTKKHIELMGFHCHVGSQVFGEDVYERACVIMLNFIKEMSSKYYFNTKILNLGGGIGVRYVESDAKAEIDKKLQSIAKTIDDTCYKLSIHVPTIIFEPGRSIVADAGMTLYSVSNIKNIPGYKNYVAIDGGMSDNPRFALYGSKYTCLYANDTSLENDMKCDLAGRLCESGDIIAKDIFLPSKTKRGDIIAVCTTGAYNYSMASNYNRIPKPPIVMLKDDTDYLAVKRETFEGVSENDI